MARNKRTNEALARIKTPSLSLNNPEEMAHFTKGLMERAIANPGGLESKQLIETARGATTILKVMKLARELGTTSATENSDADAN